MTQFQLTSTYCGGGGVGVGAGNMCCPDEQLPQNPFIKPHTWWTGFEYVVGAPRWDALDPSPLGSNAN